ncbi:MAG TPA: hypothetical protein VNL77_05630 [Roseiflexaceae bacterium]|nr:hypothetical protein [Roseiflexaceae bacterium]
MDALLLLAAIVFLLLLLFHPGAPTPPQPFVVLMPQQPAYPSLGCLPLLLAALILLGLFASGGISLAP